MNKFIDFIKETDSVPGTTAADIAQVDKKLNLSEKDPESEKICEACTEELKCDECQLAEDLEKLKLDV